MQNIDNSAQSPLEATTKIGGVELHRLNVNKHGDKTVSNSS